MTAFRGNDGPRIAIEKLLPERILELVDHARYLRGRYPLPPRHDGEVLRFIHVDKDQQRADVDVAGVNPATEQLDGRPLSEQVLAPTKIYVKSVLALIKQTEVHAIAHLTGGGFWENIPRVLPKNTKAVIDESSWEWQPVFKWLQEKGNIETYEMYRTFNCGVGMVIALPQSQVETALAILKQSGENAWLIGHIESATDNEPQVIIK